MAMLEDAASWLTAMCNESLAVRVSWRPRGGPAREIPAVVGRTVFRSNDGYGMTTHAESRDFIVRTRDMPEDNTSGMFYISLRIDIATPPWYYVANKRDFGSHILRL